MYRQPRKQFSPDQESLDVWQRLTQLLLVAVFVGVVVLVISFFGPQLERQRAMEAKNAELVGLRDDLQRQLDERHNQQRLLRTDPQYLEQFARDRLDLQRDGETIIRIDRSSGTPQLDSSE
jgi:cell division protein FtsB